MLSRGPFPGFPPERLGRLFAPLSSYRHLGLAVSGGPDSLALMVLFAAWVPKAPKPHAVVYSLDHGLRPESADEARAVAEAAAGLGLACRILKWTGPHPARGVQAAARRARYRLIGAAMAEDGAEALVVAHHGDDQAETMMMRLAHGSGAKGLAGMQAQAEVEGVLVLRPLLGASRAELAEVVAASGLCAASDPSNADPAYERVRWRAALETLAPMGVTAAGLSRLAGRMARIDRLAEAASRAFLATHLSSDALGVFTLPRAAFAAQEDEVRVRALLGVLGVAGGGQGERLEEVEHLAGRLEAEEEMSATLMGARIAADGRGVVIHREPGRFAAARTALIRDVPTPFDRRFTVTAQRDGLTMTEAGALARAEVERWLGAPVAVPMAAVHAAPAVRDAAGTLVALGGHGDFGAVTVTVREPGARAPR